MKYSNKDENNTSNIGKFIDNAYENYVKSHKFWSKLDGPKKDGNYPILDILAIALFILIVIINHVFRYKTEFIDPLENMKNSFITIQLVVMLISLAMMVCGLMFIKIKKKCLLFLDFIVIFNFIAILMFMFIKSNCDNIYTEQWFSNYYNENKNEILSTTSGSDFNESNLQEQEFISQNDFAKENMVAYQTFSIKSYICMGIYLLIELLEIYVIVKLFKIVEKQSKLEKDDIILYDENIKM